MPKTHRPQRLRVIATLLFSFLVTAGQGRGAGEPGLTAAEGNPRSVDCESELEILRGAVERLEAERSFALRRAREAEDEAVRLRDPWPLVRRALVSRAAGLPRSGGVIVRMEAGQFSEGGAALSAAGRELLARLVGLVTFTDVPLAIHVEAFTAAASEDPSGYRSAQRRSASVRTYLVQQGVRSHFVSAGVAEPARSAVDLRDPRNRRLIGVLGVIRVIRG